MRRITLMAVFILATSTAGQSSAQVAPTESKQEATRDAAPEGSSEENEQEIREARSHFDVAEQAYEDGDYSSAAEGFEAAFRIMERVHHPNAGLVLFNWAQAVDHMGDRSGAIELYERLLTTPGVLGSNIQFARGRLRRLRTSASDARREPDRDAVHATSDGGQRSAIEADASANDAADPVFPIVLGGIGLLGVVAGLVPPARGSIRVS